jgi:predicted transcriptional regulator
MTQTAFRIYSRFIGFRASDDLNSRLERFSTALTRRRSDVIRYFLLSCLNAYEGDADAIAKIRQELY